MHYPGKKRLRQFAQCDFGSASIKVLPSAILCGNPIWISWQRGQYEEHLMGEQKLQSANNERSCTEGTNCVNK